MKSILTVLFSCLLLATMSAQSNPVSNVVIRVSDEKDMITITYNLARSTQIPFYNIAANITLDGAPLKKPVGLSGDIGSQVTAGMGKRIIWDSRQDITVLAGELKIDVISKTVGTNNVKGSCTPIKTAPVYAGIGGVAAAGLGLLISGLSQKGSSNELYEVYSANVNPNDPVFSSLSRDEHYQEANSKSKQGSWLATAGGATLVAGGVAMVTRLLKVNAYNRQCESANGRAWVEPRLQLEPGTAAGPGIALVYKF